MAANTDVLTHVVIPETKKLSGSRGLNQKFLDFFWTLAKSEPVTRLEASVEIIRCINAPESTVSPFVFCSSSLFNCG